MSPMSLKSSAPKQHTFVLKTIAILSLLLVSCQKATPTQTPLTAPATKTAQPQTASTHTPQPDLPMMTPTLQPTTAPPTVTPSGPLPVVNAGPALIGQRPYPGEELALDGFIDLTFNQPMDRA